MRGFGQIAVGLCLYGAFAAVAARPGNAAGTQAADERASQVLADARTALGGEEKLAAVKSLTTTGRTRRVQGDNLVPIEFEMLVELPDKYLRKDEIPAQESDPTTTGFNGETLLQIPAPTPPAPRPGMPAPPPAQFENMLKGRLLTARQDFARLMLGMFATSFKAYPLTFKYIGQAEAPQGKAHVLEATGDGNFKVRFFVDMGTHLPIMVSWTAPARPTGPPPGAGAGKPPSDSRTPAQAEGRPAGRGAPGAPSSPGAPASAASGASPSSAAPAGKPGDAAMGKPGDPASAAPPEQRLYFSDYRDVDGIKLPFRLRRGVGTNTTEETTFDRFRINQKIDPRRFEVRK
jgi:hypothetical protein